MFISLSCFTLLNKHKKLTDHERRNLLFDRNYGLHFRSVSEMRSSAFRTTAHTAKMKTLLAGYTITEIP